MVVFTGHAIKDIGNVIRITDSKTANKIKLLAEKSAKSIEVSVNQPDNSRLHILPKSGGIEMAVEIVKAKMEKCI